MSLQTETFPVKNMTCAACARSVENMLKFTDGVADAVVNYAGSTVQVVYNPSAVGFKKMQAQIQAIGYDLIEELDYEAIKRDKEKEIKRTKNKFLVAVLFAFPVFLLSMIFTQVPNSNYIMFMLSLPVIFYSGSQYYLNAVKKLRHLQFNMDTLIAMGTGAAFLYSVAVTFLGSFLAGGEIESHVYYESAVVIIALILLGKYIEERAKSSTSKAIEELMGLQPKTAFRIKDGREVEIAIDEVLLDDVIRVLPGSKIPVDGVLTQGETYVNESMITGEPNAIKKSKGDFLTGGTINESGSLLMKTTQIGAGTVLAEIIRMVQEAQGSRAPAQKLADKISSIFVPIVLSIAAFSWLVWYFFGPDPAFSNAFVIAVTVLIIACPCALGLATPTAITVSIGKAAKEGVLVKDAETLELLKDIDVLLVDKTGTLTKGKPQVIQSQWYGTKTDELKSILFSAEQQSNHPIAKTICSYLEEDGLQHIDISISEKPGYGIQFNYSGEKYFVGRPNWRDNIENGNWRTTQLKSLGSLKSTIVEFSSEKHCIALFALKDDIKENASSAVSAIQKMGIEVVMLTGDREQTALDVCNQLNIATYHADLLPNDKSNIVADYLQKGEKVAMVGDGINDAPALALANVGIAMSTGTEVAMESAGITLLKGDILKIEKAIELSIATSKTIKQNLFWAFFYNVIAIPIAAGILYPVNGFLLNPMIAGGAMAFSSVTVVFNSLRLKLNH